MGAGVGAAPAGVEDAWQVLGRDAAAAVGHRDDDAAVLLLGGDRGCSVGGRAVDGVDEEVGQDTGHLAAVDLDRHRLDSVADEPYAVFLGQGVGARDRVADEVVDRYAGRVQGEHAGLDAGEFEQVADHLAEPLDLRADPGVVDARIVDHAVLQRLGHCLQPGERGAQVVGDPGDKLPSGLLPGSLTLP